MGTTTRAAFSTAGLLRKVSNQAITAPTTAKTTAVAMRANCSPGLLVPDTER